MAYEEALGYAIGPRARDKDGITAALVAADAVCAWAAEGRTVWDVLDDLARAHGAHVTTQRVGAPVEGPDAPARLAEHLRRPCPHDPPTGGWAAGRWSGPRPRRPTCIRLVARRTTPGWCCGPRAPRPKFKYYCEAVEPVGDGRGPARQARERAGPAPRPPSSTELARILG